MLIYKATLNQKSYIGLFTGESINLKKRKWEHKTDALNKRDNGYFHNAIRIYGWENVQWEILEDEITDIKVLNERETFNILKYDTFKPNGYNLTLGGDGLYGLKHTEETKRKIGLKHKGKIVSKETIEKTKETLRNRTKEQKEFFREKSSKAHKGIKISLEQRKKISNTLKGRIFSEEHKAKLREARKKQIPPTLGWKMPQSIKDKLSERMKGNKWNCGKHHSEETKRKISESNIHTKNK